MMLLLLLLMEFVFDRLVDKTLGGREVVLLTRWRVKQHQVAVAIVAAAAATCVRYVERLRGRGRLHERATRQRQVGDV